MPDTVRAFVCGDPIKHSRSPLIHNFWIEKYQLSGSYEKMHISPLQLDRFLSNMATNGFVGGNFTIPHKEAVYAAIEKRDNAASAIGAANTVWFEGGGLVAGNTDAYGFAANLDDQIPQWRSAACALVIGAGGASRAILFALIEAGIKKIVVVNRTIERAMALTEDFGSKVQAYSLDDAQQFVSKADLIINTTSLGMDNSNEFPLDLGEAQAGTIASDIVYVPLETAFLKAAKKHHMKTSDGIGMLLHQAVPGFERWFGIRPEVDHGLRQVVLNDIFPTNESKD